MATCEVRPRVHLGDMNDAHAWTGARLCVLEAAMVYPHRHPGDHHIAILDHARTPWAVPERLDLAAKWIELWQRDSEVPLLVHCGAGIERSPLTLAWWLIARGECADFQAAYRQLMELRPIVANRLSWVPTGARPSAFSPSSSRPSKK